MKGNIWFDWKPVSWFELILGNTRAVAGVYSIFMLGIEVFNNAIQLKLGIIRIEFNWNWYLYRKTLRKQQKEISGRKEYEGRKTNSSK